MRKGSSELALLRSNLTSTTLAYCTVWPNKTNYVTIGILVFLVWWCDSHLSPKNSKWLQENLTGISLSLTLYIL